MPLGKPLMPSILPIKLHPLDAWQRVRPIEDFERPMVEEIRRPGPARWVRILISVGVLLCWGMVIWRIWS